MIQHLVTTANKLGLDLQISHEQGQPYPFIKFSYGHKLIAQFESNTDASIWIQNVAHGTERTNELWKNDIQSALAQSEKISKIEKVEKNCMDCSYFENNADKDAACLIRAVCEHPKVSHVFTEHARKDGNCGPEGKYFEAKQPSNLLHLKMR